ncbi:flagellar biosynthesis protein FlgM [Cryomorpha ignava]|uniref:Flagellar biosynthesis protein FlgM n=1 Tax=Cryomorpha ignava TaxID=101383 RepID=A0A7K3WTF9_9FLAO|nr:neutral zinc metallopeptidase [Cryomorpha ignava]NEN24756.1 flagellar biosynthesis protein FlgM [Cryomorpha ignava]
MKWKGRRQSSNIDDRRGQSSRGGGGGLNIGMISLLFRFLFSKVGLIIAGILVVIFIVTGTNPITFFSQFLGGGPQGVQNAQPYAPSPEEEELAQFSATVLGDTEDVWNKLIQNYREPTMVLFSGYVQSACGSASSATGPFYCPADEKVYLDLSFFNDMARKLNAPGDFAQAYVIAHEVGHHVQKLMGISEKVQAMRGKVSEKEYNELSVKLELQADFLAGVWAHHTQRMNQALEDGDIQEAMNAANAIGDDRLQKQATGRVVPDAFTHGTSAQRMRWFKKGLETGDIKQGDTFNAASL